MADSSPVKDPYPFTRDFEALICFAECSARAFHAIVGHAVDIERLPSADARVLFKAARDVVKATGSGMIQPSLVLQEIRAQVHTGKVTWEQLNAAYDLLEYAEDLGGVRDPEALAKQAVPLVQEFARKDALQEAFASMGRGAAADHELKLFSKVAAIGQKTEAQFVGMVADPAHILRSVGDVNIEVLPTGIEELDTQLGGGLRCRKLGAFIAPSNTGKSFALCGVACEAALMKLPTLYVSLEMEADDVRGRMYRNLCDMTREDIQQDPNKASMRYALLESRGLASIQITHVAPYHTSPSDIRQMLHTYREITNKTVKVLVVDYADLMVSDVHTKNSSDYKDQGVVYAQLREIAIENNLFCWTASQATRDAIGKKKVGQKHISDSMEKVRKADLMVAIAQTDDDQKLGQVRFSMPKHRDGERGDDIGPLPVDWDYGRMVPITTRKNPW